jgi:hypothetical protein
MEGSECKDAAAGFRLIVAIPKTRTLGASLLEELTGSVKLYPAALRQVAF